MSNARPGWREYLPVWAFALVVSGLMLLPLRARYRDAARWPGWEFTGIVSRLFEDSAWHLSWVRQARDGYWLFEQQYAGADTAGHRFCNPFFLAVGRFAAVTGLGVVGAFHAVRTLVAALVLVAVYWFAGGFFAGRLPRWLCLILATTSGGLQWYPGLLAGAGITPPDIALVETNTFVSLEWEVIVGPATGLLLVVLGLGRRALRGECLGTALAAGVFLAALAGTHPHEVVTAGGVLAGLAVVLAATAGRGERLAVIRRSVSTAAIMLAISAPLLIYHVYVLVSDPFLWHYAAHAHGYRTSQWLGQYGLILVLAAIGALVIIVRRERHRALLVVFPTLLALVIATPYPRIQRAHLHHGLHIVLCCLAVRALWGVYRWLRARRLRAAGAGVVAVFVLAASPTTVFHYVSELRPLPAPDKRYLRTDESAAFDYLDAAAADRDVIAGLQTVTAIIPTRTGSRVYVGEPHVTPGFHARTERMEELMRQDPDHPMSAEVVAGRLGEIRADWLYIENEARQMGAWRLERTLVAHGLAERAFSNTWTAVYRVKRNALAATRPAGGAP